MFRKNFHILIKGPLVNSEVLIHLKNIEILVLYLILSSKLPIFLYLILTGIHWQFLLTQEEVVILLMSSHLWSKKINYTISNSIVLKIYLSNPVDSIDLQSTK